MGLRHPPGNLQAEQTCSNFSRQQVQGDLSFRTLAADEQHYPGTVSFRVKSVFRKPKSAFITITSGVNGASVYINGALAAAKPQFPMFANYFNGRVVLGDSPGQPDSWMGQLFGFAIYGRQLDATQVFHNYATWNPKWQAGIGPG